MSTFGARLMRFFDLLCKTALILAAARVVLLILDFPIVSIPYLDPLLFSLWETIRGLMLELFRSPYLPRFM